MSGVNTAVLVPFDVIVLRFNYIATNIYAFLQCANKKV